MPGAALLTIADMSAAAQEQATQKAAAIDGPQASNGAPDQENEKEKKPHPAIHIGKQLRIEFSGRIMEAYDSSQMQPANQAELDIVKRRRGVEGELFGRAVAFQLSRDTGDGVNWYPNRWFKLQFSPIREVLDDPTQGPSPLSRALWSTVIRFQTGF